MRCLAAIILLLVSWAACFSVCAGWDVPTMTSAELKARLSVHDLSIIDVRTASDWQKAEYKIKGAVREAPDGAKDWSSGHRKDKAMVLYCS